ncbi:hypothetical protein SASPL_141428 [Salvia splendens]|uniref:TLC domain-containing protein n=1 Tax=Salvia splendens TaxID=180675 RepID=A0A8X8ZCB3_SALSN|nr:hypothetical protein SASPL_141428 [Salvia splendens]
MGFLEIASSMDWEHESYPQYEDFIGLPLFAVFFPILRFLLDRFVFEWVGRRLVFGKGMEVVENESNERKKKIRKFKESAWKCVYFLSAEILALSVTYNEPWFTKTKHFWEGPGNQTWPKQKYKLKLKGLYMYTGGFYVYSIFALILWEMRRSDFWVSMGHHVVSSTLIILSYILRFGRVGSMVLALHDATDVFLEIGKMSKYSGAEALASCSFVMFVLLWIILRLIYYPFWILWSTSYELIEYLDKETLRVEGPIYYYVFNTLLFYLLVLHVYWWVLMFRMLVAQIKAGGAVSDDVRSGKLILTTTYPIRRMKIHTRTEVEKVRDRYTMEVGTLFSTASAIARSWLLFLSIDSRIQWEFQFVNGGPTPTSDPPVEAGRVEHMAAPQPSDLVSGLNPTQTHRTFSVAIGIGEAHSIPHSV